MFILDSNAMEMYLQCFIGRQGFVSLKATKFIAPLLWDIGHLCTQLCKPYKFVP